MAYHAARGKPKPSTYGGWIAFREGNFPAPEEEGLCYRKHKGAEVHGEELGSGISGGRSLSNEKGEIT